MSARAYSLRDLSPKQISNMIRNAERTSRAIAAALNAIMIATGKKAVDDKIWNAAVSIADAVLHTDKTGYR